MTVASAASSCSGCCCCCWEHSIKHVVVGIDIRIRDGFCFLFGSAADFLGLSRLPSRRRGFFLLFQFPQLLAAPRLLVLGALLALPPIQRLGIALAAAARTMMMLL